MLNSISVSPPAAAIVSRDAALTAARPGLEALARRLVWDREEARDVVQGALLEALDRWDTVREANARAGWLRRIVVNRAYSHLRRRRFWNAVGALLQVAEVDLTPSPDEVVEKREHQARLLVVLEKLPARQSMAFTLRYLESWSLDEVAESMNIDRGTVRIHVQRAVAALRAAGVLEARGES
ncbi:MAG: sigma-70 family RNA polymerase sigma factor [Archangium sp.]|nr:sigma-70 family RNA polymerase sigma factor [Archangium sp.]MDP3572739.1 sigma-70 family RNA polymerase sigma factor [Archangium sp.]